MKKISMETILGVLLFAGLGLLFTRGIQKTAGEAVTEEKEAAVTATVVIDAGHGGSDPGKIGINGAREKEVNLAIAEELKACLEEAGIQVVMTRSDAGGLYQESDENKKQADMRARCAIIDETGAELTVSVHQNSYPAESAPGAPGFLSCAVFRRPEGGGLPPGSPESGTFHHAAPGDQSQQYLLHIEKNKNAGGHRRVRFSFQL